MVKYIEVCLSDLLPIPLLPWGVVGSELWKKLRSIAFGWHQVAENYPIYVNTTLHNNQGLLFPTTIHYKIECGCVK